MKPHTTDHPVKQWFRSANCDGRYGATLLVVVMGVVGVSFGGRSLRLALQYDRTALAAGQWWRLLSAHVVHLNAEHAALNAAGLLLLWCLFARDFKPLQWLLLLLLGALAIDAGLWFLSPGVQWYLGASGVLHTVWAAGAAAALARRESFGVVLIGALVVKLAYEQMHGGSAFAAALPVVINAHLYGAIAGLAGARLSAMRTLDRSRNSL